MNPVTIRVSKEAVDRSNLSGRGRERQEVKWTLKERLRIALLSGLVAG
jgi:hypothetical protein